MRFRLGAYDEAVERATARLAADRAAGRIFDRDASFWGGDASRQASIITRLGWADAASQFRECVPELEVFAADVRDAGFTALALLGMGGSSLAPEVLRRSISQRRGAPALHVLDSTDPATIHAVERAIDPERTLFFASSKSGGTIEVTTLFAHFYERVAASKHERAGENFVAITDDATPLQELARKHGFRRVFLNPADIGGRYSALSYFGLAPAAAAGIDIGRLLDAGAAAERAARGGVGDDAVRLGAALGALAREGRDKLTLVVAREIGALGLWLEQLVAESTGKDGVGIVPVTDEPLGSPRKYGRDRLFVQIRLQGGTSGDQDSVVAALVAEGHPAVIIDLDSPYDLGAQFFIWELATAVAGQVLGINPFDEPNVQESKDNTARILREGATRPMSVEDANYGEAVRQVLSQLRPGGYFAITAYMRETRATDEAFADVRARVRDATGVATTLGYGPRYLHSTGQLHKGGPSGGVFLQVTADDSFDISIPGHEYTFAQLKRAQAVGDFESLAAHGRPVRRLHLGGDIDRGLAALRGALIDATAAPTARR